MSATTLTPRKIAGYGWRPDLPDIRDLLYAAPHVVASTLPPAVDLRPQCPPVFDQGQLGSCTGNAIAGAIAFDQRKQGLPEIAPSRLFIYYNERVMEGTTDSDAGAQLRDGIKSVHKLGVCPETKWAYDIAQFAARPPDVCYTDALAHTVANYKRVARDLTQMRACLADGYPFTFGFTVYSSFESAEVAKSGVLSLPTHAEQVVGGHAVLCVAGNTSIPLLSGGSTTIQQLAESGESAWVYSCDENGHIKPGRAHSARLTGVNRNIVRVTLDSDDPLLCTPDHLVMMRDGTFREAGLLRAGDSLMPLYRRVAEKGLVGYEQALDPATERWNYTHRVVGRALLRQPYQVVHHKDFDKRNNDPANLEPLTWDAHTALHQEAMAGLLDYAQSEAGRQRSRELMKALWNDPQWREASRDRQRQNGRRTSAQLVAAGINGFQARDRDELSRSARAYGRNHHAQLHTREAQARAAAALRHRWATDPAFRTQLGVVMTKNIAAYNNAIQRGEIAPTDAQRLARRENMKRVNGDTERRRRAQLKTTFVRFYADRYESFEQFLEARSAAPANHKVVAVEDAGVSNVYDLTVDGYHNFATESGIFVHNCVGYSDPDQRFVVRNSWGTDWGQSGYFTIPMTYLLSPHLSSDFWTVRLVH